MSYNKKMFELGNKGSAIRELFEYGKKRKQEIGSDNVFDYSLGNPSNPAPDIVKNTLINLLNNVDPVVLHGYTSASGDNEVKEKISSYLNEKYNASIDSKYIYMTCGAAASLSICFNALSNEDDEIICFAPFFPEYKVFIEKANAKCVIVDPSDDFQINFQDLDRKINEKTKALIIDSPNNPTGAIIKEENLIKLAKYLEKKEMEYNHSIYLISDEPYREIIYGDQKYPFVTNYYKDSIVCYSFSKSLSLPGERIGYIIINKDMNDAINVYKSILGAGRSIGYVCAPAMFQYMVKECLGYTSNMDVYKINRDLLYNELKNIGYEIVHPDGAFYMFVKALEDDANEFSNRAKDYELLLVPSDSFGIKGYVRIAYCVSTEMIKRSIPSFKKLFDSYNK